MYSFNQQYLSYHIMSSVSCRYCTKSWYESIITSLHFCHVVLLLHTTFSLTKPMYIYKVLYSAMALTVQWIFVWEVVSSIFFFQLCQYKMFSDSCHFYINQVVHNGCIQIPFYRATIDPMKIKTLATYIKWGKFKLLSLRDALKQFIISLSRIIAVG